MADRRKKYFLMFCFLIAGDMSCRRNDNNPPLNSFVYSSPAAINLLSRTTRFREFKKKEFITRLSLNGQRGNNCFFFSFSIRRFLLARSRIFINDVGTFFEFEFSSSSFDFFVENAFERLLRANSQCGFFVRRVKHFFFRVTFCAENNEKKNEKRNRLNKRRIIADRGRTRRDKKRETSVARHTWLYETYG